MVFQAPQIDSKIIRWQEVFAVRTSAQRIYAIIMAILKLFTLDTFVPRADYLRLGEDYVVAPIDCAISVWFLHAFFKLPQLNDPIVGREELLIAGLGSAKKLNGIYFFIEFQAFQMVELGLVGLNFAAVPIVEVAWVLQVRVAEDNDTATSVTHGQIFTSLVKTEGGENIGHSHTCRVALSKTIDIDPTRCSICSYLRLWGSVCGLSLKPRFTDRDPLYAADAKLFMLQGWSWRGDEFPLLFLVTWAAGASNWVWISVLLSWRDNVRFWSLIDFHLICGLKFNNKLLRRLQIEACTHYFLLFQSTVE